MDLDKTSLCEVPKALMYIVRYVPMDNDDDVNGDGRGDMADRDSSTVSRESVRLSVSVSLLLFFFGLFLSFCFSFLYESFLPIDCYNQKADYSATFRGFSKKKKEKCFSLVYGTLDTKVSEVLAVTVPLGRSFQPLMVAGKKDACLYAV